MNDHFSGQKLLSCSLRILPALLLSGIALIGVVRADAEKKATPEEDLKQALAEADRLDPGWRLEQLEAKRAVLPADKNSAVCVQAVRKLLPEKWPGQEIYEITDKTLPVVRLSVAQSDLLCRELDKVKPALAEARRLADLPNGRHSIKWASDFISTPLHSLMDSRQCAILLELEAYRQAQEGDLDGALTFCRASLNASRSIGDEPLSISQLTRVATQLRVARTLERILAQGQPSEKALSAAQKSLQEEVRHPMLLIMMRCERIWQHTFLTGLKKGTMKWSKYEDKSATNKASSPEEAAALDARMAEAARVNHGRVLRYCNKAVEIAKRPLHEQKRLFEELTASTVKVPQPVHDLLWDPTALIRGPLWIHARLHCAVVGLAVERYRQKHRRWPETLKDVPGLPKEMLVDPFDDQPLRYRRLPDGVAIWSVGLDGKDDGGKLSDSAADPVGKDVGFRLWDVEKRRQPSPDRKPPEAVKPR